MLRTIFVFSAIAISMLLLLVPALPLFLLGFLGLQKIVSMLIYRLVQGWGKMIILFSGCKFTVAGREHIPRDGGLCFVSNHGSVFDICLLLATVGRPIGFIAKKELSYIPLVNLWIKILGGLFLDRKNVRKAVKTIQTGIKRIQDGGGMLIFPEGHRSRGEGLLPFHQGSFRLATQAEAPIVPVAITGSYEVLEMTGLVRSLPVSITFFPPVMVKDIPGENRRQAAAEATRRVIAAELAKWGIGEAKIAESGPISP